MPADKLKIYNTALGHLRERRLASLTENREPRRVLDDYWDQVVSECIADGMWNFMVRSIQIDASPSIVPQFNWNYAFQLPTDVVRIVIVSSTGTFNPPLLDYVQQAGFWYANFTPLYVQYVSNDTAYGGDLSLWTPYFTAFVGFRLAEYACNRITGSDEMLKGPEGILKRLRAAKIRAKSNDAMDEPPGEFPTGTWVRSRRGWYRGVPMPGGNGFDD